MKKICKNCKWWDRDETFLPNDFVFGDCKHSKTQKGSDFLYSSNDTVCGWSTSRQERTDINTQKNFGCIHWESLGEVMKKLKSDVEDRIKGLDKFPGNATINYKGNEITIKFTHRKPQAIFGATFNFAEKDIRLVRISNSWFTHRDLMGTINTIHNILCYEENWEEVE